jgi:hypothetical protein
MQTWVLLLLVKTNDFDREKKGDRPPDTALSSQKDTALGAIAHLTLHLGRSLCQGQKSPNFHLILKIFLDYVSALAQA